MRNAGLEEAQGGIKIVGRNINNLRYADAGTQNQCSVTSWRDEVGWGEEWESRGKGHMYAYG